MVPVSRSAEQVLADMVSQVGLDILGMDAVPVCTEDAEGTDAELVDTAVAVPV